MVNIADNKGDREQDDASDRFTWEPGDLRAEKPQVTRYILMRHDPEGRNLAYLYEHARVTTTEMREGTKMALDIVEVRGADVERAEFNAKHQLGRLRRALESRSNQMFVTWVEAHAEALRRLETYAGLGW